MKRRSTLIAPEVTGIKEVNEKLPIGWRIDKSETKISERGVKVILKYHPNFGNDKEDRPKTFEFSNEELEAIRLKNQPNNVFDKIGLIRALSRTAQDKIMADVNKRAFDCYHENGLDKTVELFETDPRLNYLLRGFALYEAKLTKINASASIY